MNNYSDAIEILRKMTPEQAVDIVFDVAKNNPSIIAKAVSIPKQDQQLGNTQAVLDLIVSVKNGMKINAIRAIRQLTELGLREAKDIIDQYI